MTPKTLTKKQRTLAIIALVDSCTKGSGFTEDQTIEVCLVVDEWLRDCTGESLVRYCLNSDRTVLVRATKKFLLQIEQELKRENK